MSEQNTRFIECDSCSNLFNVHRRCIGDPFRCAFCGFKHENVGFTDIERRVRNLLTGETRSDVQTKVSDLSLERGRNTSRESTKLYLMQAGDNMIKIGVSTNPQDRLKDINVSNSDDVHLRSVFNVNHPREVESELHRRFADKNKSGEWFELSESIITDLESELQNIQSDIPNIMYSNTSSETKQTKLTSKPQESR